MSDANNIQNLATIAASFFETKKRADGTEYVAVTKENRPEWLYDAVREAHDGLLPDDYIFRWCADAMEAYAEGRSHDDYIMELEAEPYTGQLLTWLASGGMRVFLCDEAVEEYEAADTDTLARIKLGQIHEKRRCATAMWDALEKQDAEEERGDE